MVRSLAALLLVSTALLAQEYRASLTGIVTDPSGAPVPGAIVKLTSLERSVNYDARSNDAGVYGILFLPPGDYSINVEKEGFKKFVRDRVTLAATDKLKIDVGMEVGSVVDSVTVTTEVAYLETESATRTALIQ